MSKKIQSNEELQLKIYELIEHYQNEEIHAEKLINEIIYRAKQNVLHELLEKME